MDVKFDYALSQMQDERDNEYHLITCRNSNN